MAPVTVATAVSAFGAEIIRGRLADAEIWAEVVDAEMATMSWDYVTALGGVKVRVAPDDEADARALLAEPVDLDDVEKPTQAERYSWTALIAAATILWFPPLILVAVWAIGRVIATADDETLRTWRRTGWAALFVAPFIVGIGLILRAL